MKFIVLIFSAILIGLDQFFKKLVLDHLVIQDTVPLINDVFHLTYVENRGAAFGIFQGSVQILSIVNLILILVFIGYVLFGKPKSKFVLWSLALIIGGGIGNLIDRLARGFVIDYLDFRLINFAVFNFADMCTVIGTILLMAYIIFFESKKEDNSKVPSNKIEKINIVEMKLPEHKKVNKFISVIGEAEDNDNNQQ
ncbi:MAG: signal peptidase II [Oscillospiraceae bacterium]